MTRSLSTWKMIAESLAENIPVMLLYVPESKGSSPGRPGFFMAVNAAGEMEGSIGGGIMEHKFVEMARENLLTVIQKPAGILRKQVHDASVGKNRSGMICSGEQTILLCPLKPSDRDTITRIIDSLEKNTRGTLRLRPDEIHFDDTDPGMDFQFLVRSDEDWEYRERTGYRQQLSIVGGGHCALALSRLMSTMDFYIRVYDDRKNLKTMLANDYAHEKHWVNDYSALSSVIRPGENHYVVIMSFGYRTDDIALRALFGKQFTYLGVLGSESKMKKMLAIYRKEGIADSELKMIHTPVGLPIRSQTPEEIAVSIAAEIILEKNALPS